MKTATVILSVLAALAAAKPAAESRKRGETVIASAGPDGSTTQTIGGSDSEVTGIPDFGEIFDKRGETVIASAGPDGSTTQTIGGPGQTANATAFPGETVTANAGPGETVNAFGRRRRRGETVSASAGPDGSTTVTIGGGFQTANGTDCNGQTVTASAGPGETVSASAGPGGSTTVTFMG